MRIVAVATLLALALVVVAIPPTNAADQCKTVETSAQFCTTVPVNRPSPPPPAPGMPPQLDRYWDLYYVFVAGTACTSPTSQACRGTPAASGSGVPLPTGGEQGLRVFGVVWQESNNCVGLQRNTVAPCLPDRMILV